MEHNGRKLRFGRTLTFRELARRGRRPGLYTRDMAGFRRAYADMINAVPCVRFLLGLETRDRLREIRAGR